MNSGYLGDKTPKLGFGLMRLPMLGDEIDMEQVKLSLIHISEPTRP